MRRDFDPCREIEIPAVARSETRPTGPLGVPQSRQFKPVASTKLLPPNAARRLVPREQLVARLLDARLKRCVVVEGPAGCGKTSTLIMWRKALLTLDNDVAWFSFSAEDNDPARFLDCLLASLAEVDASSVREAALLMGRDSGESALEHWVITVVQGLAQRKRELVLMLDDLQHLTDPRIAQALQWLVEYAPRQVHLALASRRALPLTLSRLRSHGQIAEFNLRDLRFSAQESEVFLKGYLGTVIDRRDSEVVHALTDGWIAGLQLFAADMKTRQGTRHERARVRDARAFAGYFEREVLACVDHNDLELLTRIAVCNRFCASLCAALMEQPRATARMRAHLARLDNDALFISQVDSHSSETWYRLHPLLREVLLARLEGQRAPQMPTLQAIAWRWFHEHGQIDEAVRHAVQAGEPEAAAGLIEQCVGDMLAHGDLGQLSSLLRRLPREKSASRVTLRLMEGRLALYARNLDCFARQLEELERDIDMLNPGQRQALSLLRAGFAMQRDDSSAVARLLGDVEEGPDDGDQNVTGRANILSWMHMYGGRFDKARQVLSESAGHTGSQRSSLIGKCLSGMAHELEGQVVQAERIFRDVLHEAESRGSAFIDLTCMASGLLGDTLYELNDLGGALHHLEERAELIERVSTPDTVLRTLLALSNAHWLAGRRLEAEAYLDHLEEYGARHQLDRLRSHALAVRLRWRLDECETRRASHVLTELQALALRHANAEVGTLWEVGLNAGSAEAEMLMHRHDYAAAAPRLEAVATRAESGGRWRRVANLRMRLAVCERRRGRDASADAQLTRALTLGHRLGLIRTLLDASPDVPCMLAGLAVDALHPVIAFYVCRLRENAAMPDAAIGEAAASRANALNALSERENQVLDLLALAMPNKKIARALGLSLETVKWHLKNIYAKLGVTGRDEAVSRLRDQQMGDGGASGWGCTRVNPDWRPPSPRGGVHRSSRSHH